MARVGQKYISWFSCGAPSAVAAMLAIREFGKENVRVIRQDTGSEHPDNERFMADFEAWQGIKVEVTKSEKYSDVDDVIEKCRFISGVGGARCTGELKRVVAENCINWGREQEIEIFGYTIEEKHRVARFIEQNNERKIDPILIRHGLGKGDCKGVLWKAGIDIPQMYLLGYNNNNCIGCVKGSMGYWNKIRVDFPDVFARRALQERDIGAAMCKVEATKGRNGWTWPEWAYSLSTFEERTIGTSGERARCPVYLDELPPHAGNHQNDSSISCGLICMMAAE